jgi:hypothetical protein
MPYGGPIGSPNEDALANQQQPGSAKPLANGALETSKALTNGVATPTARLSFWVTRKVLDSCPTFVDDVKDILEILEGIEVESWKTSYKDAGVNKKKQESTLRDAEVLEKVVMTLHGASEGETGLKKLDGFKLTARGVDVVLSVKIGVNVDVEEDTEQAETLFTDLEFPSRLSQDEGKLSKLVEKVFPSGVVKNVSVVQRRQQHQQEEDSEEDVEVVILRVRFSSEAESQKWALQALNGSVSLAGQMIKFYRRGLADDALVSGDTVGVNGQGTTAVRNKGNVGNRLSNSKRQNAGGAGVARTGVVINEE